MLRLRLESYLAMIVQRMMLLAFMALTGAIAGACIGCSLSILTRLALGRFDDSPGPYYAVVMILGAFWGIAHHLDHIPARTPR
jgi:hypothetical protein